MITILHTYTHDITLARIIKLFWLATVNLIATFCSVVCVFLKHISKADCTWYAGRISIVSLKECLLKKRLPPFLCLLAALPRYLMVTVTLLNEIQARGTRTEMNL